MKYSTTTSILAESRTDCLVASLSQGEKVAAPRKLGPLFRAAAAGFEDKPGHEMGMKFAATSLEPLEDVVALLPARPGGRRRGMVRAGGGSAYEHQRLVLVGEVGELGEKVRVPDAPRIPAPLDRERARDPSDPVELGAGAHIDEPDARPHERMGFAGKQGAGVRQVELPAACSSELADGGDFREGLGH